MRTLHVYTKASKGKTLCGLLIAGVTPLCYRADVGYDEAVPSKLCARCKLKVPAGAKRGVPKSEWLRATLSVLFLLCLTGCTRHLIYAESSKEGEKGIRVEIQGGLTGSSARLENVGRFAKVPPGWTGPVPWTVPAKAGGP